MSKLTDILHSVVSLVGNRGGDNAAGELHDMISQVEADLEAKIEAAVSAAVGKALNAAATESAPAAAEPAGTHPDGASAA